MQHTSFTSKSGPRLLLLACALSAASAAHAFSFQLTELGTLGQSGAAHASSMAFGLNAAGQVVGVSNTGGPTPHEYGFIWTAGSMTALPSLDANGVYGSIAYGINAAGTVVGSGYTTGALSYHGIQWPAASPGSPTDLGSGNSFSMAVAVNASGTVAGQSTNQAVRWVNGVMSSLPGLGGSVSGAWALNDAGQIVGDSGLSGDVTSHATLWTNGAVTDLGTLSGGTYSSAWGINAQGHVIGYADKDNNQNFTTGVLWKNGQMIDLGTLGGDASEARGINKNDWVVGGAWLSNNAVEHATLWSGSSWLDLNGAVLGGLGSFAYLELATAVNDAGQIVGYGKTLSGDTRAFLLTPVPVPEPSSYALMLLGLGLLAGAARRRAALLR
ncbi:PEP-CTERM sorting domain-containing protein [Paucibacter sp. Y2R2-4]|uniref:PEP-CTERM sorting domain-containing protein n=1 Tax=Paucibacter sp. Y2R2-4 TaxID=2893553 RepID=UPI0021E3CC05|nr:PEP-CTERM sorting domain-containing protein [Paucibacter sp. Y2R2-4]MCV2352486.1 PEP-CTERM sorting domain-containing protein [Paucibacter sp. Y2R2-4]